MPKLINKPTPKQIRRWGELEAEWHANCLRTDPCNRPQAERAIAAVYAFARLHTPKFEWFDSPAAIIDGNLVEVDGRVAVKAEVMECVHVRLARATRNALSPVVLMGRMRQGGLELCDALCHVVNVALYQRAVRKSVATAFTAVYGQHDSRRVAEATFARECVGSRHASAKALNLLAATAAESGWWLPFQGEVLCCDRASAQRVNERNVPHCGHAPAVEYRDGFKVWVLDGHNVDERLVMSPETQTLEQISAEPNAELKRIRIERYAGRDAPPAEGWKRYLEASHAYCLDRRRNDVENTEEVLMSTWTGLAGEKALVCACPSTARLYALEVPPWCRTVAEAQEYLHSQSKIDETDPNVIGRS